MSKTLPPCGLYLRIEASPDLTQVVPSIRQATLVMNRSAYEQNMHIMEIDTSKVTMPEVVQGLIQLVKNEGVVALLRSNAQMALDLDADGVLTYTLDELKAARALLPEEKIVGLSCTFDRDLATQAIEAGADYVVFSDPKGIDIQAIPFFNWWSTMTDVPAVAQGGITNDNASTYVKAGVTFLDCSDYVWKHTEGIKQGVVNMLYAIDLAAEKATLN